MPAFNLYFHSLRIKEDVCKGCTHCLRNCPTEAIRVRNRLAQIKDLKCIDCGDCVRFCPWGANEVLTDDLSVLSHYEYRVLVIPPAFLSLDFLGLSTSEVMGRIFALGFQEVYEEGIGEEAYLEETRRILTKGNVKKPLISVACPAVIRLMQVRFPDLLSHLSPLNTPRDILGATVRRKLGKNSGLFYLAPCPAKITAIRNPQGIEKSPYDGVIAANILYREILRVNETTSGKVHLSGPSGVAIGRIGGEKEFLSPLRVLAIDGITNVVRFLKELEMEKVPALDLIEGRSCPNGCVGGILLPERDSFLNLYRLEQEERKRENAISPLSREDMADFLYLTMPIQPRPQYFLSENMEAAAKLLKMIDKFYEKLPKIDCGSCGAPTCRALAEDVAKGEASLEDCIFL
ncbi:MAG: 4Fe-4S dicluster domain-containing protein [Caldiserica bacterium]|nr:4Fe-4S dicluster domain-containing protein [Caldisericota bacterium]